MPNGVKCKVKSCYFWNNTDLCGADSIMVDNNLVSRSNMEIGSFDADTSASRGFASNRGRSAGTSNTGKTAGGATGTSRTSNMYTEVGDLDVGGTTGTTNTQGTGTVIGNQNAAKTSHETLCSTFRPKGSESRH